MKLSTTRICIIVLGLLVNMGNSIPVLAQTTGESAQTEENSEAKQKPRFLPPAYNDEMLRLSELLGSLHYLRELCGAKEGQLWRDQMQALIKNEQPDEVQKAQLIASFNRGFRGLRETHVECTPTAIEISNNYLVEGARISAEIPLRYGR